MEIHGRDAKLLAEAGMVVVTFNAEARIDDKSQEDIRSEGEEDFNGFRHQDGLCKIVEHVMGLEYVISDNVGLKSQSYGITMAAGCAGRHPEIPIKYLVDGEGPPHSFVTCHGPRYLAGDMKIDGFISPGHVSTIIGSNALEVGLEVPQVISGFSPEQMLKATLSLLEMIKDGKGGVKNEYPEAVKPEGNIVARKLIEEQMQAAKSEWRGIGELDNSGLEPKNDKQNARVVYADKIAGIKSVEPAGCRCGEVLKGLVNPSQCPLFRKYCTPESPKGACMVSEEGSCNIWYRYHGE